jgi:predicted ATPase
MLTEWTIGNFKSFSGNTTIPLAPITILAGANSSGKSSIIQSILLIKQTLQYAPTTRPIGLNGPLLKLGRFDDIKNAANEAPDIELGWVLDESQSYRFSPGAAQTPYMFYPGEGNPTRASIRLTFGVAKQKGSGINAPNPPAELSQLQPTLTSLSFKAEITEDDSSRTSSLFLNRKGTQTSEAEGLVGQYSSHLPYAVRRIDSASKDSITGRRPESSLFGADVRHFLPFRFGFSYNQRLYFSQKVSEYLVTPNSHIRYSEPEIGDYVLPPDVVNLLVEHLLSVQENERELPSYIPRGASIAEVVAGIRDAKITAKEFARRLDIIYRHSTRARQALRTSIIEKQEEIQHMLFDQSSGLSEVGFDFGYSHDFAITSEYVQNFFQSSIHYLGPLRDEPRPIYPLEALINPKDVGYKGEHTAAVLDLHRETPVECFKSSDANMLIGAEKVTVPLLQAVQDWLSYLGVAEAVATTDLGKIGHQLQVSVDKSSRNHDLTNVGVGVSQLLPIVVMSLLANSPCLLVFEQPELHLHPKVQARLADFFFSLSLLGKQCLLETHSEYLVERFRLRIAQAPGEELNARVKIYFTQKIDNQTICTQVKLSKYGAVLDWPEDFFDQSENETEAILRAAQAKRKSEKNSPFGSDE